MAWLTGVVVLVIRNLPHLGTQRHEYVFLRREFLELVASLADDLGGFVGKGDVVAFLPYRNHFLANYAAWILGFATYNIGEDKNLVMAKKYWLATLKIFLLWDARSRVFRNSIKLTGK